jgi:hypothetical protein
LRRGEQRSPAVGAPLAFGAMRAIEALVLAAVVGLGPIPGAHTSAATTAPVRECGDLPSRLAYNITSRVVSCREARRVARAWTGTGRVTRVRGFTCRYRDTGYEAGDIRCTRSGDGVVRWQTYS